MPTVKLIALALVSALAVGTRDAAAHAFSVCKNPGAGNSAVDKLHVESLELVPDPPHAGKNLKVSFSGTSQVDVEGGDAKIEVKMYGVTVMSETHKLCDVVKCPLKAGEKYEGGVEQLVPAETPDKLTATVRVTVHSPQGQALTCLEAQVTMASKDHKEVGALGAPPGPWGLVEEEVKFLFHRWREQFNKRASTRMHVFRDNLVKIATHNADKSQTFTMGLNEFADMTPEEFARERLSGMRFVANPHKSAHAHDADPEASVDSDDSGDSNEPKNSPAGKSSLRGRDQQQKLVIDLPAIVSKADPPAEIDWVARGAVTSVKNQGSCGSCWAFSAVAAMESAYFLKYGQLVDFSEQELVSCDGDGTHGGIDFGCQGGLMDNAFDWVMRYSANGLCSATDYPYESGTTSARGTCRMDQCTAVPNSKPVGIVDIPQSESALLAALAEYGPIAVAIEADQAAFQFYRSGVMRGQCGSNLNHGVLAVGAGVDPETGFPFWKVKNSWGAAWGEDGYIRIQRGRRFPGPACGITLKASRPVY